VDLGLQGKVALVTGAGSQKGFGKAIAMTLAKEGCDIVACDIDIKGAEQTAAEVKALGRQSLAAKVDITRSVEVNDAVKKTLVQFGRIDILVNNAGAISSIETFVEKADAEWNTDIDLNLKGTLIFTKAVLGHMISRKKGKIINISSIGAIRKGKPRTAAYGAAKAGVIGFTQCLGVEVAALGINVNCVAPGLGLTNFGGGAPPPNLLAKAKETIPSKRTTMPQDIANMVTILASDVSDDVVGQTISVDGGESLV
jgi:NAD(P)-dependent dehydrogenase (short-subunit alcohol dehydrogenase family)